MAKYLGDTIIKSQRLKKKKGVNRGAVVSLLQHFQAKINIFLFLHLIQLPLHSDPTDAAANKRKKNGSTKLGVYSRINMWF